ncbi:50S ribosomal protein L2 [Candidatus Parcubacteria bacterium]|nr:MAG: 50S ribosomal protein L2 [Candidatus Parcubacteria bacterium]
MKRYRPTSPARRQAEMVDMTDVTKKGPEKSLTVGFRRGVGRNAQGRITTRHKGGGAKRRWRMIDFNFDRKDMPAVVEAIEYDPNRTARIALVRYQDGERRYILAPAGLKPGARFIVSKTAPIAVGNRLPLAAIPVGTYVFNIELTPEGGGKLVRSAGVGAQLLAVEGAYAQLKLPSGEIRMVRADCWATIGSLSNAEWSLMSFGKAGRMRHRGIRPTVRGSAMNPRDHPYGGGEGRAMRGTRRPKTAWGKITGGVKTRRRKWSDRFIVQRRKR